MVRFGRLTASASVSFRVDIDISMADVESDRFPLLTEISIVVVEPFGTTCISSGSCSCTLELGMTLPEFGMTFSPFCSSGEGAKNESRSGWVVVVLAVVVDVEAFESLFLLRCLGIRRLNRIVNECRYDLRFRDFFRIGRFSGVELRGGRAAATNSIALTASLGKVDVTGETYVDGLDTRNTLAGVSSGGKTEGSGMGVLLLRSALGFGGGIGLGALLAHLGTGGGGRSGGHSSKL